MNKSILISLKPKQVANIFNGKQSLIISKSAMPKCKLPIEVFIYCTKNGGYCHHAFKAFKPKDKRQVIPMQLCNNKIVAHFTLNEVEEIIETYPLFYKTQSLTCTELEAKSCLTYDEIDNYIFDGIGYAWHISNLQIFDKPISLPSWQFMRLGFDNYYHQDHSKESYLNWANRCHEFEISAAPHSWRYVEFYESEENKK